MIDAPFVWILKEYWREDISAGLHFIIEHNKGEKDLLSLILSLQDLSIVAI